MSTRALVVLRTIRAEREKRALELERRELITHTEVTASGLSAGGGIINRLTDEALTVGRHGSLARTSSRFAKLLITSSGNSERGSQNQGRSTLNF